MDEYLKIDKTEFRKKFKEKYGGPFILEVVVPYERFIFVSSQEINNEALIGVINSTLQEYGLENKRLDTSNMNVKISSQKEININIKKDLLADTKYNEALKMLNEPPKTQILFNLGETVMGTNISISVIKKLQTQFQKSLLLYKDRRFLNGNEIQLIKVDSLMNDPEFIEMIDGDINIY
ncbi:MAG: hypothetical protein AAF549_08990 [Pseudomonadota bacterium]